MSRGTWQGGGTWQTTGGGGGLVLAVIAAAVLIGSGAASAAVSALVTVLIIVGAVIALAVLGVIAWLVHRARQDRRDRQVYQLAADRQAHDYRTCRNEDCERHVCTVFREGIEACPLPHQG